MIMQFHVKNYKALRDVTLPLTQIHVLIGPNDSGKTSILEALPLYCPPSCTASRPFWKCRRFSAC
ncbi:MAG: AAA family ATPase [Phycisphaerae bacterium]